MLEEAEVSEDRLLGGELVLLQPRRGHRAGTDAVLLAALARPRPGDLVADLGAATGAVGLIVGHRAPETRLAFLERDPDLVDLCRRNLHLNGLEARGRAFAGDLFGPAEDLVAAGFAVGAVDLAVTNPPYFEEAGRGRSSPEPRRRSAHDMAGGTLMRWCEAAAALLKPKGRLVLIHRADALERCLAALKTRFGSLSIRPIYPRAGEPASRVVIEAVKGGRAPVEIAPALVLHEADGRFTPEAERLHNGSAQMEGAPEGAPLSPPQ